MNDFKEAFTVSVTDALDSHCNTLDLRMPLQCKFWIEELPDQVQRFITLGGYRLYPDYIKVEQDHKTLTLFHSWKNYRCGVYCLIIIPIGIINIRLVCFDECKKRKLYFFIQNRSRTFRMVEGNIIQLFERFNIPAELQGKYTLCVGLTDKTKK